MSGTPELLAYLGLGADQFNYLMGLTGIMCALLVGVIWSRGL